LTYNFEYFQLQSEMEVSPNESSESGFGGSSGFGGGPGFSGLPGGNAPHQALGLGKSV